MPKTYLSNMDDSHDSGISTEKESEEACTGVSGVSRVSSPSSRRFSLLRRAGRQQQQHQHHQHGFKSLTALGAAAKDSLEQLQHQQSRIRRRSDGSRRVFFGRSSCSSIGGGGTGGTGNGNAIVEKRGGRRKYQRKRFEKSNVSEVNVRRATNDLTGEESEMLVNVVSRKKLVHTSTLAFSLPSTSLPTSTSHTAGKPIQASSSGPLAPPSSLEPTTASNPPAIGHLSTDLSTELLHHLEKLGLGGSTTDDTTDDTSAHNPEEAKSAVAPGLGLGSGDAARQPRANPDPDLAAAKQPMLADELAGGASAGMACSTARIFEGKVRKSGPGAGRGVQWKREVDVIYYAGEADGGKIIRRESEPLREEADQQARRHRFLQLALTKNLMSNVSVCQLREPWLVVLPK